MGRRPDRNGRLVKKSQLLGKRFQAIGPQYDPLESNPAPETSRKELPKHRLEIGFPTGAVRQCLPGRPFGMVAMADNQREASADPPLLPERRAGLFDQTG